MSKPDPTKAAAEIFDRLKIDRADKAGKMAHMLGTLLAEKIVEQYVGKVPTEVFQSAIAQLHFAGEIWNRDHVKDDPVGEPANTLVV